MISNESIVHSQIQFMNWQGYKLDSATYRSPVTYLFNEIVSKYPNTFVCNVATSIMACGRSSHKQRDIIINFSKRQLKHKYDAVIAMGVYER